MSVILSRYWGCSKAEDSWSFRKSQMNSEIVACFPELSTLLQCDTPASNEHVLKIGSEQSRSHPLEGESEPMGRNPCVAAPTLDQPVNMPLQGIGEAVREALAIPADLSDEFLLEQVSQGGKEALAQLFRRHARTVRNVAYRILRNEAEADDLVQDVFLFLFRKAALFNPSRGRALSWIVQVAYHRAFDRRRRLITRHFYASLPIEEGALQVPDRGGETPSSEWSLEAVWGRESAAQLRELLSPSQLATIELFFFEGYTLEEIAERLDQTLGNVRHHYYRGLEKLRQPAFAEKLRSK
jgi:RNA polymerase sigma-70 factor, ECF subfamily